VGTELEFEIVRGEGEVVRGRDTVVRMQAPSWFDAGGCALRFDWVESLERPAELVSRADRIPAGA
jgi:hypothetical protein